MMKYLYLITFLFIIGSCNYSNEKSSEESTAGLETEKPTVVSKPVNEISKSDLLLGSWKLHDEKIDVTQIITYKDDGTYQMKMATIDINGTWELIDSVLITKSNPEAEGQKKTITKLDSENLWTIWEPEGGKARELKYTREEVK